MVKMIKSNHGVSLVEILVSVSILGILATITIPSYQSYRKNAFSSALKQELAYGAKAYALYGQIEKSYCADFEEVGFHTKLKPTDKILSAGGFIGFKEHSGCASSLGDINIKGNPPPTVPEKCILKEDEFFMGAKTNVAALTGVHTMFISKNASGNLEYKEPDNNADNECHQPSS